MKEITMDGWVELYGSATLQNSVAQGYTSKERYLNERAAIDYPGFFHPDFTIEKTDSPPDYCLEACSSILGAFCSHRLYRMGNGHPYYLTIDNYLGEYTIVKEIIEPNFEDLSEIEIRLNSQENIPALALVDPREIEKSEWILFCGSDLLKDSYLDGYTSEDLYFRERLSIEHPGFFYPGEVAYERIDSPPDSALTACLAFEGAYCAVPKYAYKTDGIWIAIDNYLGKWTIVMKLDLPVSTETKIVKNRKSCAFPYICLIGIPMGMIYGFMFICSVTPHRHPLPAPVPIDRSDRPQ